MICMKLFWYILYWSESSKRK